MIYDDPGLIVVILRQPLVGQSIPTEQPVVDVSWDSGSQPLLTHIIISWECLLTHLYIYILLGRTGVYIPFETGVCDMVITHLPTGKRILNNTKNKHDAWPIAPNCGHFVDRGFHEGRCWLW